jgi:hypothetical protein
VHFIFVNFNNRIVLNTKSIWKFILFGRRPLVDRLLILFNGMNDPLVDGNFNELATNRVHYLLSHLLVWNALSCAFPLVQLLLPSGKLKLIFKIRKLSWSYDGSKTLPNPK